MVGFHCVDLNADTYISNSDTGKILSKVGKTRRSAGFDFQMDLDWNGAIALADVGRELGAVGSYCPGPLDRYTYDGMGTMVKRAHYNSGDNSGLATPASWTEYIDGIYEKTNTGAVTKYYYAFGRSVAMRTGSGPLTYFLADHLGSTVGAIDGTGTVTTQTYWPFGGTRTTSGPLGTDKQYTGQQQEPGDAGLGLYNYKARFYSTTTGRFVSADPHTSGGLNRFSYVANNPMKYVDPSGLDLMCLPPGCSGSADDIRVEDGICHLCEALIALAPLVACAANPVACNALAGPTQSPTPTAVPTATAAPTSMPSDPATDCTAANYRPECNNTCRQDVGSECYETGPCSSGLEPECDYRNFPTSTPLPTSTPCDAYNGCPVHPLPRWLGPIWGLLRCARNAEACLPKYLDPLKMDPFIIPPGRTPVRA